VISKESSVHGRDVRYGSCHKAGSKLAEDLGSEGASSVNKAGLSNARALLKKVARELRSGRETEVNPRHGFVSGSCGAAPEGSEAPQCSGRPRVSSTSPCTALA
jgi:hypothetical protein